MQKFTRELQINAAIEKDKLVEFSVASSEPFFRADDDRNEGYYEVLEISETAIDFSRLVDEKSPLLLEHDPDKQIGVVEKAWIEDGKLKANVRFSKNAKAQEILNDVKDCIRRNVSVGYIVEETRLQQNPGDFPTIFVERWTPYEISIVSCPADHTVGYLRNLDIKPIGQDINMNDNDKDKTTVPSTESLTSDKELDGVDNKPLQEQEQEQIQETKEKEKELEQVEALDETEDILAAGELAGEEDLARQCIKEKRSLKEFKQLIKNKRNLKGNNSMENKQKYSITKAIRSIWKGTQDAEYEMNLSRNASRSLQADDHDLFIPFGELRALGPGAGSGGALINTTYLPAEYVPLLRPELSLEKTGFHTIPSDGQPVSFAVMTSGATAGMYDLDGQLTDSDPKFTLKTLTPKKAGICVPIPFSLILQAQPEADAVVEEDMVNAIKELRDKMILIGSGTGNQPTGIYATAGVNEVPVSGIYSWEGVVAAEAAIRKTNVTGNLFWVMNSNDKAKFETTLKDDVAGATYLCEDNKIKGYEVVVNNFLADGQIILGDFTDVAVAEFGPLKVKVDDITLAKKQAIQVIMDMEFDCCVRRPGSFTIVK